MRLIRFWQVCATSLMPLQSSTRSSCTFYERKLSCRLPSHYLGQTACRTLSGPVSIVTLIQSQHGGGPPRALDAYRPFDTILTAFTYLYMVYDTVAPSAPSRPQSIGVGLYRSDAGIPLKPNPGLGLRMAYRNPAGV